MSVFTYKCFFVKIQTIFMLNILTFVVHLGWICQFQCAHLQKDWHYFCNPLKHLWIPGKLCETLEKSYFWKQKPCIAEGHGQHFLHFHIFLSKVWICFQSSSKMPKCNIYVPKIWDETLFDRIWDQFCEDELWEIWVDLEELLLPAWLSIVWARGSKIF